MSPVIFPQAFALLPGEKRPAVKWSDSDTCKPSAEFDAHGVRYGLPTGPRNGIFVVDIDRKNGKDGLIALAVACGSRELPDTYTVRTPSGGLHLYFAWDPEHPVGNPVGVLEGVDVRGDRGYVCAGGDYKVTLDLPIATAPEWLYEIIGERATIPSGESAVAIGPDHPEWDARLTMAGTFLYSEPPCISGQGGQKQLWKIALRLMRTYELPVDAAVEKLREYNARCQPPWSEADLRRTLIRAAEEGQGPTGTFAHDSALLGRTPRPKVPVPMEDVPVEEWRRRHDPAHRYATVSSAIAGAVQKCARVTAQELTQKFAGPGAEPMWLGVFQWDMFRRRIVAVDPPCKLDAETTGLSKRDMARIQVTLSAAGMGVGLEAVENAILVAAGECEFHPVRDYLDSLPTMSLAEAEDYFRGIAGRLWGAEERNELESSHIRRLAIAAVRRIREPGTKVDSMLVLAGEQGLGKSQFCRKLFGEFFLDQMPNLEKDKEASIAIEGYWGIEFGEFRALRVSEATKKEFITRCEDKYRPVWESQMQVFPRQCVFIATTNEDDFLTDPTGDTRYDICDVREPIRLAELDRDRFWAAANVLEAAGELHWRDRAARARASGEDPVAESAGFYAEDPWTSVVLKYAREVKPDEKGQRWVRAEDALSYGLVMPTEKQDAVALKRVKAILRRAYGAARTRRFGNDTGRAYRVRVEDPAGKSAAAVG